MAYKYVHGDIELFKRIEKLLERAPQVTSDAVNEFAINVQAQAKQNLTDLPAVDTGRLRASIGIDSFEQGLARRVGSNLNYAAAIEFGQKPHFPPLEPIRQWCKRHGIDEGMAYVIARKISQTGQPAKPYLFPAYEAERPKLQKVIRETWRELNRELDR